MTGAPRFRDYPTVQDYLFSLKAQGVRFGIDRMRAFNTALGSPDRRVPCIHVAGTNGKGSTAAMIESILRAAGAKVGLYTSPHLIRLGERVQVNRRLLSPAEIMAYVNELAPVAERLATQDPEDRPSFFEFMTAMAFLQFARQQCDWSVVEVGMGGRLDATNVVEPEVAVITSIGLDHCEFLGDTVELIAAEKAGILKPGRPVVMGRLPEGAEQVVRRIAHERGCPLTSVREVYGESVDALPATALEGNYQRWNAATATLVCRALAPRIQISDTVIQTGLARVSWPGRWQRLEQDGWTLVLDASHNPEGAEVLAGQLARLATEGRPIRIITGVLGAARARPLLETVARFAQSVHLVVPQQARACSHTELRQLLPTAYSGEAVDAAVESLFPRPGVCTLARPGEIVVVTGSIYLLGEVLARWSPQEGDLESKLQDF